MGVDILSRQVTLSKCISSECKTWNHQDGTTTNTNSVKRSLFGPVDHQDTMTFFQKELTKMEEEQRIRWNFDFVNEKPLRGNYKWEKVENIKPCKSIVISPVKKVTKSKTKRSPLKSRVNRDNLDIRSCNKQTTITDYIHVSKSIARPRTEKDTRNSKEMNK